MEHGTYNNRITLYAENQAPKQRIFIPASSFLNNFSFLYFNKNCPPQDTLH
jgi:hypothetical protein